MKNKKLLQKFAIGAATLGTIGSLSTLAFAETPASGTMPNVAKMEKHKGLGFMKGRKNMTTEQKAKMDAMHKTMEATKKAFEAGDYNAFHAAVAGNVKAEAITLEQFNTIIASQKILKDAGLMMGHGMK